MSQDHRDAELFNKIADQYAKKDIIGSSSIARKSQLMYALKPLLKNNRKLGTLIDIGCGIGAPAKYLNGLYEQYIGIDHSQTIINAAKIFHKNNRKVKFVPNNIKACPLSPNKGDVILCIGALHHMSNLNEAFESIVKLAKPGADFIAIEPQRGNPIISIMRRIRKNIDKSYSKDQIFFTEEELLSMTSKHNISNISFSYQGFFSPPFAQVILNPQFIFKYLSMASVKIDELLNGKLNGKLGKLSFNIVLRGKINK